MTLFQLEPRQHKMLDDDGLLLFFECMNHCVHRQVKFMLKFEFLY